MTSFVSSMLGGSFRLLYLIDLLKIQVKCEQGISELVVGSLLLSLPSGLLAISYCGTIHWRDDDLTVLLSPNKVISCRIVIVYK